MCLLPLCCRLWGRGLWRRASWSCGPGCTSSPWMRLGRFTPCTLVCFFTKESGLLAPISCPQLVCVWKLKFYHKMWMPHLMNKYSILFNLQGSAAWFWSDNVRKSVLSINFVSNSITFDGNYFHHDNHRHCWHCIQHVCKCPGATTNGVKLVAANWLDWGVAFTFFLLD